MRAIARLVPCARAVTEYALRLVMGTHPELEDSPEIIRKYARFGASPRAAQALISAARVRAMMAGRYNVAFEDIRALAVPCLCHRIAPSFEGFAEGENALTLIEKLLLEVKPG